MNPLTVAVRLGATTCTLCQPQLQMWVRNCKKDVGPLPVSCEAGCNYMHSMSTSTTDVGS